MLRRGCYQWKEGDRVGVGWHGGNDLVREDAGAEILPCAVNRKSPGMISMAVMPNS